MSTCEVGNRFVSNIYSCLCPLKQLFEDPGLLDPSQETKDQFLWVIVLGGQRLRLTTGADLKRVYPL